MIMNDRGVLAARSVATAALFFAPLTSTGCVSDLHTEPDPDDVDVTSEALHRPLSWEIDSSRAPADAPSIASSGEDGASAMLVWREGCAIRGQAKIGRAWQMDRTLAEDNACEAAPNVAVNLHGAVGVQWTGDAFDPGGNPTLQQPSEAVLHLASVDADGEVSEAPGGFMASVSAAGIAVTKEDMAVSLWNFGHRYGGQVHAAMTDETGTERVSWPAEGSGLSDLQIGADGIGGAVAVWFAQQGTRIPFARLFDPDVGWREIQQLGDMAAGSLAFRMAPGGLVGLLAWGDARGNVVTTRAFRGGAWDDEPQEIRLGREDVSGLALAYNDRRAAALLYLTGLDQTLHAIHGLRDRWSRPQRIDRTTDGILKTPSVTMDSAGNAFAVWVRASEDGGGDEIWGAYALTGQRWRRAVRIGPEGLGPSSAPQLAIIGRRDVLATWSQVAAGDGSSAVFVARLH
jgi:hypothetical protein